MKEAHSILQGKVSLAGFTLLELLIACMAASLIMIAIYGVFLSAIRARDNATTLNHSTLLRARATKVIRNDLENAYISGTGGIFATTLQGDSNGTDGGSTFPGYLKLTTTGGKDTIATTMTGSSEMYGDVEQVEYYIVRSSGTASATGPNAGGDLVRVVTRDLLDSNPTVTHQQEIMPGVQSFQVSFYDGAQWQTIWQISGTTSGSSASTSGSSSSSTSSTSSTSGASGSGTTATVLPAAIRVDIQQATPPGAQRAPAPVEVLVQWTTAPFLSGTNFAIGSGTNQ